LYSSSSAASCSESSFTSWASRSRSIGAWLIAALSFGVGSGGKRFGAARVEVGGIGGENWSALDNGGHSLPIASGPNYR
jgi:hypothetical protein